MPDHEAVTSPMSEVVRIDPGDARGPWRILMPPNTRQPVVRHGELFYVSALTLDETPVTFEAAADHNLNYPNAGPPANVIESPLFGGRVKFVWDAVSLEWDAFAYNVRQDVTPGSGELVRDELVIGANNALSALTREPNTSMPIEAYLNGVMHPVGIGAASGEAFYITPPQAITYDRDVLGFDLNPSVPAATRDRVFIRYISI